jgi:hypothetical protein
MGHPIFFDPPRINEIPILYAQKVFYNGKTLEQWMNERKAAYDVVSEYGYRLKNEGKTKEEIISDPEYLRLREQYYDLSRSYEAGCAEWRYQEYEEAYQNALDYFKSFGFEEFHDINDPAWQLKLSEAVSGFHFAVSGTAKAIQNLMAGNTEYRISLAYADDDGVILGNVSTIEQTRETFYRSPIVYWIEEKLSKREQ